MGLALGYAGGRWLGVRDTPAADVAADAPEQSPAGRGAQTPAAARTSVASLSPPASPSTPEARQAPRALAPAWRRFAATAPVVRGRPMIAVVIDDLGQSAQRMRRTIALKAPLTLAVLPHGRELSALTAEARRAGHELLVHLPMEPEDPSQDPGPEALVSGLDEAELLRRLEHHLSRFGAYVGVNNHMGSRFSSDAAGMATVLAEVGKRGLLYLDSRTTPRTLASALARSLGVPEAERDVFLDNDRVPGGVGQQLAVLEETARRQGFAVAIGHPHPETLEALEGWLAEVAARGFVLVPVSAIVEHRMTSGAPAEGKAEGKEFLEPLIGEGAKSRAERSRGRARFRGRAD